ncbi:MAG TPA: nitroreductase [Dyella sp.]|uniref:nitroreductase family protein n=1 Tax=Dyella sp. TaxID=1869338 RepID=UPI002F95F175
MLSALELLQQRHSAPSRQLREPAPDEGTLRTLLETAIRVPDHGKLEPFRLILLRGDAKLRFGERLTDIALRRHPDLPESKREKERLRYTFAPLVVAVVARIQSDSSVPAIEQQLSAGCVAHNLLLGAYALGFGAQWLTGWAAYDREAGALLGLAEHEHMVGFVHIGTPDIDIPDRDRPDLDSLLSTWTP